MRFRVGQMLLLTAVVAAALWAAAQIVGPRYAQWVMSVYLALLGAWVVLRGPVVYQTLVEVREKRSALNERRAALASRLESFLQNRRRQKRDGDV